MQFPLTYYYFAIRQNVLSSNRTYVLLCILSVYIILVSENKSHIVEFLSYSTSVIIYRLARKPYCPDDPIKRVSQNCVFQTPMGFATV